MNLTEQQALVLFDIAKCALNQSGGFAGYSNEEIMKLLNQIISQQDNDNFLTLIEEPVQWIDIKKAESMATDEPTMKNLDENFWDDDTL